MDKPRVIIIGAGPSGVRCASRLVAEGLRPTVVDENRRDGGQIYRRQPEGFTRPYDKLYGTAAGSAQSLHEHFDALRDKIDYWPETLAWNISDRKLHVVRQQKSFALPFDALVLCTGATDRLFPVKGWQYAGTYSLGAAQIALKAQACAIGQQIVFLGTGPLLYLVASQYLRADASVAAVLDTSALANRLKALPKLLARPGVLADGLALLAHIKRAKVPVLTGVTPLEIIGSPDRGVEAVTVRDSCGKVRHIACDAVGLGYHLRPESQLADLARCDFHFDDATRQWLPIVDEDGRSSTSHVYLAGDGVRVLGADAAEVAGQLAAMAVLQDFGLDIVKEELQRLRGEQERMRRFSQGLTQAFPWPALAASQLPDDAIVCRCELITAGELRGVVSGMGGARSESREGV